MTTDRSVVVDSLGVGLATGAYGASFGAIATGAGLDVWQAWPNTNLATLLNDTTVSKIHLTATDLDTLRQGAMFMTEQGAGSDIAATAVPVHSPRSCSAAATCSTA